MRSTLRPASLRKLEPRRCKFDDAGVFYRDRSNIGWTIMGPAHVTNFGQARFCSRKPSARVSGLINPIQVHEVYKYGLDSFDYGMVRIVSEAAALKT